MYSVFIQVEDKGGGASLQSITPELSSQIICNHLEDTIHLIPEIV